MIDYVIMGGILLFLLLLLAVGAKYCPEGNSGFFDQNNSRAMRGFWCLIVILVHISPQYQNVIQDMIGSFAYIGVTFFFMSSAYGLSLSARKGSGAVAFWVNRLPKLMIPNWLTNLVFAVLLLLVCRIETTPLGLVAVNIWVKWLLACYIFFWLGKVVNPVKKLSLPLVIGLVVLLSGGVYYLKHVGIIAETTWCTEIIGFVWGVLLFSLYDRIKGFFRKGWLAKTVLLCLCSLVLGVSYLRFKPVLFWGDYVLKIILGLSILCFVLILNSKFALGNRVSAFLGDISFEVYLVHVAVMTCLATLFPTMGSGLFILSTLVLSILFATIIHKVSLVLLGLCAPWLNKLVSR